MEGLRSISAYPCIQTRDGGRTIYRDKCKNFMTSIDENIKSPLCFGSEKGGIPVFAGYSFALKLVLNYVSIKKVKDIRELFIVEPSEFIECYKVK